MISDVDDDHDRVGRENGQAKVHQQAVKVVEGLVRGHRMNETGTLIQICLTDAAGAPMRTVPEAECVSGRGIAGDRYFLGTGTFSPTAKKPSQEVTLVEVEEVDRFNARSGACLQPHDLRRNLITRGIGLNDLVGRRFVIGSVVFEGIRLCEPCSHLAGMTRPDVLEGLVHRAGLRAAIVEGGTIRVGDAVYVPR